MSVRMPEPSGPISSGPIPSGPISSAPATYVREVRRCLADLPPALSEELLDGLDEHLAEVAADSGRPLEGVLGTPAAYAQELRLAAELPEHGQARHSHVTAALRASAERLRRHDAVRSVLTFLPELRPAWWVARAWLALLALDFLFGSQSFAFPLPSALGLGAVLGLPLVIGAVVLSVQLGRRAQRRTPLQRRARLLAIAGNSVLALLALVAVAAVQQRSSMQPVYADDYATATYGYGSGNMLVREDGTPITNLYPYSSDGEPLTGVLLYDQDGRAVDNLLPSTLDGTPIARVLPTESAPQPGNAFPQRQRLQVYDDLGNASLAPEDPRTVPTPSVTPVPTSPNPSPTPSPTRSPEADRSRGPR